MAQRTRTRVMLLLLGGLVAAGLAACGTARRGTTFLWPMDYPSPQVAFGEQVFMRSCNQCHPRGEAGVGFALNNKPLPDAVIRAQVRLGVGAMPAFPQTEISDRELEAIVAYLDHMRERGRRFENTL